MKSALTNLKNKSPQNRGLNPLETRRLIEESWQTYPNKHKILLDVYGGQREMDGRMINLHNSIAELDVAWKKKIDARLRDSARGYYSLECNRKNKNLKPKTELEVDRYPVDKTIQSGKLKYC